MNSKILNNMKKFTFVVIAALAFAACQKGPQPAPVADTIKIEPVITRALGLNFNSGDKVGLTVVKADGTVYAENNCMTYTDGAFASDLKWYAEGGQTCSMKAYYPFQEAGFPSKFAVQADQSKGTESSDLMVATKNDVYPSVNAVMMNFKHQFAQIVINVDNGVGAELENVTIKGLRPAANVSMDEAGVVTVAVDETVAAADILAEQVKAGEKFCAVVVPQTFSKIDVVLNVKGASAVLTSIDQAELKAGYSYNIALTISSDSVTAKISGDIEEWADGGNLDGHEYEVPFEEHEGYFLYDDVRYNTVQIGNRTWMAEPMAFVPQGATVSEDPAKGGIWYPYAVEDGVVNLLKDASGIKANGYLYSFATALGVKTFTDENYATFEGTQGICPKGWHVPSRSEYYDLCGESVYARLIGEGTGTKINDKSIFTDPSMDKAIFWDSSLNQSHVSMFNEGGFNFVPSGCIANKAYNALVCDSSLCSVESFLGKNRMTYYLTSTASYVSAGEYYFFGMMSTFTAPNNKGKVTLSNCKVSQVGAQLRCVKDVK